MTESHLDIFFCHHTKEAFTLEFGKLFSRANVLVVENGFDDGTASNLERAFNKLSQGLLTIEQMQRNTRTDPQHLDYGFYKGLQTTTYKSKKNIILEHTPLTKKDNERWTEALKLLNTKKELSTALPEYRRYLKLMAADQGKRNISLGRQLQNLTSTNVGKRILLIIGGGHERPLKKCLSDVAVSFGSYYMVTPMKVDIKSELMTKFELDEYVSDMDILQAMAENFMHQEAEKVGYLPHAKRVSMSESVRGMPRELLEKYVAEELKRE
jgi:hypothetical protein